MDGVHHSPMNEKIVRLTSMFLNQLHIDVWRPRESVTQGLSRDVQGLNPKLCQPHLRKLLGGENPPRIIFPEYIPNMEMINLGNYIETWMNNLLGIREIHKAGEQLGDIEPRDMLIVKYDPSPDRVV
ncbi:conserved hypothetical protein [Histoplasma capsulatum G186AR]|uniref:Uncharacterized protein n=1 Tax=Ajellomyces capsulatus (strain G186AR / H82 / ATCC MYA-2454 / RMSCC 2432) TaxID=447093 RepID=C0NUL5_AJECG|nr:uncharacterized protein HCBG_07046 [Histoplasma capsulatum G186AR]EEH05095.1 conserved hypothetical protein [Histoplasma capsulatum G186AR]